MKFKVYFLRANFSRLIRLIILDEEVTRDKISADIMKLVSNNKISYNQLNLSCDTQSSNSEQLLMMASGKKKLSDVAETCGYLANLINLSTNAITQKATIVCPFNFFILDSFNSERKIKRILCNFNLLRMVTNTP